MEIRGFVAGRGEQIAVSVQVCDVHADEAIGCEGSVDFDGQKIFGEGRCTADSLHLNGGVQRDSVERAAGA